MEIPTTDPTEQYGYEARILSRDAQQLIVFADEDYAQKICQCFRFMTMAHSTNAVWEQVTQAFEPLRPFAASLILEARGGSVIATVAVSDFFAILDLGPRVLISDRFVGARQRGEAEPVNFQTEIADLVTKLSEPPAG